MDVDRIKERATFSIDAAVKDTLEKRVPKSKRSAFVERAIADALRQEAVQDLKRTLDRIEGYSAGGEDSVEILRRVRREQDDFVLERHGTEHFNGTQE
ncbi:MAG: hypothetical protein ACXIVF_05085 [Rhizobiaceae bacterium]